MLVTRRESLSRRRLSRRKPRRRESLSRRRLFRRKPRRRESLICFPDAMYCIGKASLDRLYRAALLRNQFADTILKAREKHLKRFVKLEIFLVCPMLGQPYDAQTHTYSFNESCFNKKNIHLRYICFESH